MIYDCIKCGNTFKQKSIYKYYIGLKRQFVYIESSKLYNIIYNTQNTRNTQKVLKILKI